MSNIAYDAAPFPLVHGSLPEDFYKYVLNSWPPFESHAGDHRKDVPVTDEHIIDTVWQMVENSCEIFRRNLTNFPAGYRKEQLRLQYSQNPGWGIIPQRGRGWHLDAGNKLIIGLWYFRDEQDHSTGGNLRLMNPETDNMREIEYQSNSLILFPNIITSWHEVTTRLQGNVPRRFLNILVENEDLYDLGKVMHQYLPWDAKLKGTKVYNETHIDSDVRLRYDILKQYHFVQYT